MLFLLCFIKFENNTKFVTWFITKGSLLISTEQIPQWLICQNIYVLRFHIISTLIALRYNDRSRWLLFTEAKLFGLNGIIMHRGPCAALNVRKALDSSATRAAAPARRRPGRRRVPSCMPAYGALRSGLDRSRWPPLHNSTTVVGQQGD